MRNEPKLSPSQTGYGPEGSKTDERFPEDTSAEGWEEEEGVCPPAQTATTSASTGDIQKRSQKVKTTKEGIRNQDQRRRNQVGRRMTYPSHGYDDLKKAFLENYLQQKKCIKDPIELHNIKQRDGESTEDFVRRGEVAASNHEQKKSFPPWKQQEGNQKQNFKKRRILELAEAEKEARSIHAPHKNPQRNFCFRKREFQSSATNDDSSREAKSHQILIIGRLGVKKLQVVPSTTHGMLKLPVEGGVITLKSSRLVPLECALVSGPEETLPATKPIVEERVKVAINPEYPKQTCLVDKAFHKQIGRNLKVYVDELVIKSRTEEEAMFLGYKVNTKGLKVCPDKVDAVLSLPSPKCLKEVQKLNKKLASLNRFLAKSAEKSLPFFKIFKKYTKKSDFYWTAEAEEVFRQMKQLIAKLTMLIAPMEKEKLIVYLAAAKEKVSAVLMTEREAKQMPIYFVSKAFRDGSGAGLILTNLKRIEFTYALRFRFDAINNEAEYEALIAGLRIAEQMGVKNLQGNVDSRLVANQVNGTQVPRSENKKADALSKIACTSFAHLSKQVLVAELKEKSICELEILAVVEEEGDTWMTLIFEYLTEETLPADVKKARADNPFKDWCEKLCIRQHFASVKHPQINSLVERANRSLGEGIKARLDARSKNWMEELSHVL
ncbi:reverse transcriptase domain-containing protein [Tanacetum coccineum]